MTRVTTAPVASSTFDTSRVHSLTRPNMVSVGTIIWLSSELMFFAGLFAMYFTARARATEGWPPEPTELNLPYATIFTVILVRVLGHLPVRRVRGGAAATSTACGAGSRSPS